METLDKLEHAVEELIDLFKEQQDRLASLEEELEKVKEGKQGESDWAKEKKAISKKVSSIIQTIESAGVKLKD